jgi:hypothetical protein
MLATDKAAFARVEKADKQSRASVALRSSAPDLFSSFRKLVLTSLPYSL